LSLQERALKLAYEARDDIFKTESSVTSIIRKCYTICQLLKKDVDWIKNELYGYGYNKTFGELYEIIPSYRIVNLYYVEYNDRLLYGSNKELRKYPLPTSISNIEKSKNGDITIVRKLDEYIEAPVKISNYYVTNILNFVKNRSLEFLNEIILELEYGNISSNIFNDYKKKL